MSTDIVSKYIGNFAESIIVTSLLALLFEPYGVTPPNKHDGCILPHDTDFESAGPCVIIAADMKSTSIGSKDIFVKMNANLVQRARG